MTMDTHEKAKYLRMRIHRIDGILELLNKILAKEVKDPTAIIQEAGFVSHPSSVLIDRAEITVLVKAFETERANIEREFEQL